MTLRPSALQVSQIGKETTPGTSVAANLVLPNTRIVIRGQGEPNDEYMANGHLFPADSSNGLESGGGTWDSPITVDEGVYIFNSLIKHVNGTGAGAAKTHVYTPSLAAVDTHDTYTGERGMTGAVRKFTMMVFNTMKLLVSKRERAGMSGAVLSQEQSLGTALTAAPTTVKSSVIPKTAFDIYWSDSWANLQATPTLYSQNFRYELDYGPVLKDAAFMGSTEPSFDALGPIVPATSLKLTLPFDVSGTDFAGFITQTKKRNSTPVFLRLVGLGDLIETGTPDIYEKFQIDMCLRARNVPDETDIDNVFLGLLWELGIFEDPTSGKAFEATLIGSTI